DAVPAAPTASTTAPAPAATVTQTGSPVGAPLETFSECTIAMPESWLPLFEVGSTPGITAWLEQEGQTLTWHGDEVRVLTETADPATPEHTDGRHAAWVGDDGRVMVWDARMPEDAPVAVTGPDFSPVDSLNSFQLDDGVLWLSRTITHSDDYKRSGNWTGRVEAIELDGDRVPRLVVEAKGLDAVGLWDGAIQVMIDGGAITLYEPDGTVRDIPLPEELQTSRVLSHSDTALLLYDRSGTSSLYLLEEGKRYEINSPEGPAGTVSGDWALLSAHAPEARQTLVDLRNRVRVNLPDLDPSGNAYGLRDGVLWVDVQGLAHPIAVEDLPPVGCG
ncbi:hypothetical protein ACFQ06_11945, partial [Tessaracoccus lubricantis]